MSERLVVVGGGPAALSAARGYREAGGRGAVVLLCAEDRPPYERPPLSKTVLRGGAEPEDGELEPPEWFARNAVSLRVGARAVAVDRAGGEVELAGGERVPYDRLVLATGSRPVRVDVPGVDAAHVHTLRSARDALSLRAAVASGTRVAVIGTGFIGCEAAVSLARRGAEVTLAGLESAALESRIGAAAGARVSRWIAEAGVTVHHETELRAVGDDHVELDGGRVDADVVLLVTGVERRTELARDAALALGDAGILAGLGQRTHDDAILAAGDCAQTEHPLARRPLQVEHWGDALAQGAAAGRRAAGDASARWDSVPGFWSQIGDRWLKQAAWGDGWADERLVDHPGGGWTVWYADEDGRCVGVLTHDADVDWERGRELVADGAPCP